MGILQPMGQGQGYLKAGFQGFNKSGKTWTGALLCVAAGRAFKYDGPIAMFDTEGGSEYIAPMVKELTGKDMVGVKSRSLDHLMEVGRECVASGVKIMLADSMTHVWRELCETYLASVNEKRRAKGWGTKSSLEFQDWGPLKARWAKWTDFYLNSDLHIVICGRAGYEYDMRENDKGKNELVKTGTKMKTEGEFGFEPSLLVEMERNKKADGDGGFTFVRTATVLGDRFGDIDGREIHFPSEGTREEQLLRVAAAFGPHLKRLKPDAHTPIDMDARSEMQIDDDGDDGWARERKARAIVSEEIQALLVKHHPKQNNEAKVAKAELLHKHFGTRSWTAIESTPSSDLRSGLASLRAELEPKEAVNAG